MTNPTHTNLDQLFNKAKSNDQNLDDFDKDALAGFNMLESKNEAHQLQTALDDRIKKSLFTETKKNNLKVYWLAAAGLALVIGLTTLFVLNSNNFSSNKNSLAITSTEQVNETNLPESEKKFEEPSSPPITSGDNQILLETTKNEAKPTTIEDGLIDRNKKENEKITTKLAAKINLPLGAGKAANEETLKEQSKPGAKNDGYLAFDDKNVAGEKDQGADEYRALTKNTTPAYKNPKMAEDREAETKQIVFADMQKSSSKEETAFESELEKKTVTLSTPSDVKAKKAQEKYDKNESHLNEVLRNDESTNSITSANSGDYASKVDASPAETSAISSGIAQTEAALINCYYVGGEPAITKDLKEKLLAENLNKPFDATLYINEKKKVDKVEFTNTYKLSENEKESITQILKSLTQFNFFVSPTKKGNYPYQLKYKPIQ